MQMGGMAMTPNHVGRPRERPTYVLHLLATRRIHLTLTAVYKVSFPTSIIQKRNLVLRKIQPSGTWGEWRPGSIAPAVPAFWISWWKSRLPFWSYRGSEAKVQARNKLASGSHSPTNIRVIWLAC